MSENDTLRTTCKSVNKDTVELGHLTIAAQQPLLETGALKRLGPYHIQGEIGRGAMIPMVPP